MSSSGARPIHRRLLVALAAGALLACEGSDGPTGPTGPEGPVGPQGPSGVGSMFGSWTVTDPASALFGVDVQYEAPSDGFVLVIGFDPPGTGAWNVRLYSSDSPLGADPTDLDDVRGTVGLHSGGAAEHALPESSFLVPMPEGHFWMVRSSFAATPGSNPRILWLPIQP